MQDAINKLCSDNARKNSKKILVDMLDQAVDTNLLVKNVAKQINPIITREKKKERRGELCGLTWENVDFKDKLLHVRHSLCYFSKDGKYVFEIHDTKTDNGERTIPLTDKAFWVLKKQRVRKQEIIFKGKIPLEGYENLVFCYEK